MKTYKSRFRFLLNHEQANEIGFYLEKRFPEGRITPTKLLEIARDPSNPLHKYFEWDNEKAAEKHRMSQAGDILRCVYIELDTGEEVRAYHHIYLEDSGNNEYVSLEKAMESPPLWKQVVERALHEAESWKEKYKIYKELAPIVEAIETTSKTLTLKEARI